MYSLEDNHESDNWQDQTTTTRPNKKAYESNDNNYTKKYKKIFSFFNNKLIFLDCTTILMGVSSLPF